MFCHRPIFVTDPFSLWVDLPIYSPSKFWDPSRLLRNALVCRHICYKQINEIGKVEFLVFLSANVSKQAISGLGIFQMFLRQNQYIFRKETICLDKQYMDGLCVIICIFEMAYDTGDELFFIICTYEQ